MGIETRDICGSVEKSKLPKEQWPTVSQVLDMNQRDITGWCSVDDWWFEHYEEYYKESARRRKAMTNQFSKSFSIVLIVLFISGCATQVKPPQGRCCPKVVKLAQLDRSLYQVEYPKNPYQVPDSHYKLEPNLPKNNCKVDRECYQECMEANRDNTDYKCSRYCKVCQY